MLKSVFTFIAVVALAMLDPTVAFVVPSYPHSPTVDTTTTLPSQQLTDLRFLSHRFEAKRPEKKATENISNIGLTTS